MASQAPGQVLLTLNPLRELPRTFSKSATPALHKPHPIYLLNLSPDTQTSIMWLTFLLNILNVSPH